MRQLKPPRDFSIQNIHIKNTLYGFSKSSQINSENSTLVWFSLVTMWIKYLKSHPFRVSAVTGFCFSKFRSILLFTLHISSTSNSLKCSVLTSFCHSFNCFKNNNTFLQRWLNTLHGDDTLLRYSTQMEKKRTSHPGHEERIPDSHTTQNQGPHPGSIQFRARSPKNSNLKGLHTPEGAKSTLSQHHLVIIP